MGKQSICWDCKNSTGGGVQLVKRTEAGRRMERKGKRGFISCNSMPAV